MLDFTSTTSFNTSPGSSQVVRTGQSIAKTHYSGPRADAREAAAWVLGLLAVKPTVKLAARAFGVCPALVSQEIVKLKGAVPASVSAVAAVNQADWDDAWWTGLTSTEQVEFVSRHLASVWTALETAIS
jgi:hypothetical protein